MKSTVKRFGFDLTRHHYYSPIPDLAELPPEIWERQSDLAEIDFDVEAGLEFVERELATYISQYAPPTKPTGDPRRFHLSNDLYERLDAETLYAMIRHLMPTRIVELGSGMSTLVIADARADSPEPNASWHAVYDPFPRPELAKVAELHPIPATEIPAAVFEELQSGDVLFIDTTHTVKVGGDVNRIVLEALPRLAPGVCVHIHDIFLPYEYPREFVEERSFFWAEQYLLQAFLAFNRDFEVIFGNHAMHRRYPERLAKLMPRVRPGYYPSAFWLRRTPG